MGEILTTVLIGIIMGFSSGMFGIGGSIVATPFLKMFLTLTPIAAIATPLPAAIPSAASGSIKYHRSGLINYRLAGLALTAAVPFGILGTWVTGHIDGTALLVAKAIFLALLGIKFFVSSWLLKKKEAPEKITLLGGLISGALAGFVAGVIAVGGGIIMVTAFVRVNNLPMKNAVATSLLCVGILAIINSIGHFTMGHIDTFITLILAATVIPFSYLGAKLAVSLRNKTLERLFGILMIIFAIYFIILQLT